MVKIWELDSFPEKSPFIKTEVRTPDGLVFIEISFREMAASSIEDTNVMVFTDNGRRMCIAHDSDGAYKYSID